MSTQRVYCPPIVIALIIAVLLSQVSGFSARPARAELLPSSKIDPQLLQLMTESGTSVHPVIVEMVPSHPRSTLLGITDPLTEDAFNLLKLNGIPVGKLALINAAAGYASAAGIQLMSANPAVAYIHLDYWVGSSSAKTQRISPIASGSLSSQHVREIRADKVWAQGTTGKGVTVAVLDSGIAPDRDLTTPSNRLVASVNFADDRGLVADPGGHGTHVAGIIAGNGVRSEREYVGVAPDANVIDVRVLDEHGHGRVSSIVRGIEWVLAHSDEYNIRIINLSLGAPATKSYHLDPLAAAVEIAWKRGLVVVAAAGNDGPHAGTVHTPGIDPYVITVGATDDQQTRAVADDVLAWFSSWESPAATAPKPDVVAPGRKIVSIRSTGSYLDRLYADRVTVAKNGATYFRLTGTSMSTAVVSGVAALLLQRQPDLSPDQVKAILVGTVQPYGQDSPSPPSDPSADGSGLIDAYSAVNSPAPVVAPQSHRPSDTFARALYPVLYGQPLVWNVRDYLGIDWGALTWSTVVWDNAAWDNVAWDAFDWSNAAWDNAAWDNAAWDNAAWDNAAWDNAAWDNAAWDNAAWDGSSLD